MTALSATPCASTSSLRSHRGSQPRRLAALLTGSAALLLVACASPGLRDADALAARGRHEQALATIEAAQRDRPADLALRTAAARQRELATAQLLLLAEQSHATERDDVSARLLDRVDALVAQHPRAIALRREIDRGARHVRALADARTQMAQGRFDSAEAGVRELLAESPNDTAARALLQQLTERSQRDALGAPAELAAAYRKPVSLEFRDAPLRAVFESMSRAAGANFVFDKDVRGDAKVTIFLRNVTVDEAMRVILSTQGLDRKVLNDSSVLIYPNTAQKQREHQELVTRSIYLANADVKQAQTLVRTMAKTRDLFIDERLNLLVVRDTPEVVRLVERLVESIDLVEPEVMLDVEVLEVASSVVDNLGIAWPDAVSWGLPDAAGQLSAVQAPIGAARSFRGVVLNPALVATLKGTDGNSRLLANPRIRARNREKAKIQIGDKLPVFTTTSTANVGVSASVAYLDVGLKVDLEPSVQLDNDVVIRVALEVSNLVKQVSGPQGSIAYQIGTRQTSTSLRLRDGETQVISGLINDEDRRTANGVPGLSTLPVLGRLFGVQGSEHNKTEVVLLVTPHVLRNLSLPGASLSTLASGTDAQPGTPPLRLRSGGSVGVAAGGDAMPLDPPVPDPADATTAATASNGVVLTIGSSPEVAPGGTVSVTLSHNASALVSGELEYDVQRFQGASARAADAGPATPGRIAFELPPQGQRVIVLRALPGAAPGPAQFVIGALKARSSFGRALDVTPSGEAKTMVVAR